MPVMVHPGQGSSRPGIDDLLLFLSVPWLGDVSLTMLSWSIFLCRFLLCTAAAGTGRLGGSSRPGIDDFLVFLALNILVRRILLCLSISRRRSFVKDMLTRRVDGIDAELEDLKKVFEIMEIEVERAVAPAYC